MLNFLGKWLNIYRDEIALFLWCAALLFLIRSSNVLFNNFAETAFLKRYGVEYLPVVYMINSVSTFFIMGFMTGIMGRLPGSRLLSYMLLFCGVSVAGLRFVIPLDFSLLYPILFILKSQYEVLLGLVFWNLANDLFNTRQSKRLFPLITAGGVLGGVIGSFATPSLAKAVSLDNLLFAYLVTTVVGAMTVKRMGTLFPTLLLSDKTGKKKKKSRSSTIEEFKKVLPMLKESKLVKILIMLTLMPNVVIPIMNYQFNFAVNETFATEGKMIAFFGYFRGVLNFVSLVILLFVGKIYGRWGLPVALMFHPFNYMLAFLAFLLKFNIFSAMYARISTIVLRTTINNPARAVLVGLVPPEYRAVIRPFLRGTVVRIGILIGSGLIMASEDLVHPRYLSVVSFLFVAAWIISTFVLKKGYAGILLDLISRNMLDLKSMEGKDVSQVFSDKKVKSQLAEAFLAARGKDALWHARLLKSLGPGEADPLILRALRDQDEATRIGLLETLSPELGQDAVPVLRELADPNNPALMVAVMKVLNRVFPGGATDLREEVFESSAYPEVKAHAVSGLYRRDPQRYKDIIDGWLGSKDVSERRAGVIAAGESGDTAWIPCLKEILTEEKEGVILALILEGLHRLGADDINALVLPYLSHPMESVRLAALEAFEITDESALKKAIILMDDASKRVRALAKQRLETAPYQNAQILVESLTIPRRQVREGIFELLNSLNIKDLDVYRFARAQLEKGYGLLAEAEGLRLLPESRERDLLIDHLNRERGFQLENIMRVLATQDATGQMRIIWRGIFSADARQRSNSLEALDDVVDVSLSRILIPLLEDLSPSQTLQVGRKSFDLPKFGGDKAGIYAHFLAKPDWVTLVLTLYLVAHQGLDGLDRHIIDELSGSENTHVRDMAQRIIQESHAAKKEEDMEKQISIPDKIIHLKGIQIFEGLSVSELAAVASVTEEVMYPKGEIVIKEGEPGETMYLIIQGEVAVIKGYGGEKEIELDRIREGDYFGEMALFEDSVRSATIRTSEESRLLVLHKREFTEIVREYPQIALHICRVLSKRLRELHAKVQSQ